MKFSICVPMYNVEQYLEQCLNSVLLQTEGDYEVILIDDGSEDNTGEIADNYCGRDKRFRVIHQKNTGLFHARVRALNEAVGEYVIHLDSDDWLEPKALETISRAINKYDADVIIYNNFIGQSNDNKKLQIRLGEAEQEWSHKTDEIIDIYFNTVKIQSIWRKAIRRSIVDTSALSKLPRITMTEDWIHSYYPMVKASTIVYIPDALYNYRITPNSMCKVFDPLIYDSSKIIYNMQKEYVDEHPLVNLSLSPENWLLKKIAEALVYNLSEVRDKKKYYDFLSKVSGDNDIKDIYKRTSKVQMKYKIPLKLLFSHAYRTLYAAKRTVVFLRKHILS